MKTSREMPSLARNRMLQMLRITVAASAIALLPAPALADAIDGDWCSPGGKHIKIDGPKLVTPAGAKIEGNYTRHAFSWVAPASEPDGGKTIYMVLLNDENAEVRIGSPVAKPERWKRCQHIS